ncbi:BIFUNCTIONAL ASPARTATE AMINOTRANSFERASE AND GLUTAMATE/ASPARTATE-PREPHENATE AMINOTRANSFERASE-RELATED [Salix viminalis]|uniref:BIFUNCTIONAL ASPARTATE AMINOTRANSFERASE AND GLUTAMATE/ASPARTATE-PREPHENATE AMINOTRANSFERASE-RELATED n=1 Tax=Salix viminalis TaxID=40686 RepID=A0A9Q0NVC0_SALVM|nr:BIFUNCTIONAL ASPARTATE AMINOTRANSFERASE AND GLUTAMATE/ASPARTATE-PREPHENATE AMINOTRANSFERASE-RELATED [Salix viminalis]
MASFFRVFSLRNLLVLSLALNVSLIWRVLYEKEYSEAINGPSLDNKREAFRTDSMANEAQPTQRTHLYIPSSSSSSSTVDSNGRDRVINLDHGDPTMYERYWQQTGDKSTILIPGWQSMSYFSDAGSLCWFLEPDSIKLCYMHSPQDAAEPLSVVSAAPYYSSYPSITDCLKSGLYKWAGDAQSFNKEGPYIELVTSPNNPDGHVRQSVVNKSGGILVHDLAYYWPQYSPIAAAADHDIMLFTVSKKARDMLGCGSGKLSLDTAKHCNQMIKLAFEKLSSTSFRWALVKDEEVAKKMVKYVELNTIGVSKDSQLRAAKVLQVATDYAASEEGSLFDFAANVMEERWKLLRAAVRQSGLFTLPEFSPGLCRFLNSSFAPRPAFAWLKCEEPIEDCEAFLRSNKILTRGGKHFGVGPQYVRISMLDRDEIYDVFVQRLSTIHLRQSMQVDETVE